jgi:predicted DNA-binding protein (UPF0251 family)
MARPEKSRSIDGPPRYFRFSADEAPSDTSDHIKLRLDEFEALRLSDGLGYGHAAAATIMDISRPTFTRLLNRARVKLAEFLINGRSLEISGGSVLFSSDVFCCRSCRRPFKWEKTTVPVCTRCGCKDVLAAQASCSHDCRCCEQTAI